MRVFALVIKIFGPVLLTGPILSRRNLAFYSDRAWPAFAVRWRVEVFKDTGPNSGGKLFADRELLASEIFGRLDDRSPQVICLFPFAFIRNLGLIEPPLQLTDSVCSAQ
jgi:hypothetical protein